MTKVLAFGDWHANTEYALGSLNAGLSRYPNAHLVHVGDFGFWNTYIWTDEFIAEAEHANVIPTPTSFKGFVAEVNSFLESRGQVLHVVLGNHENYWEIPEIYGYSGLFTDTETSSYDTPVGAFDNPYSLYCTGMSLNKAAQIDSDGFLVSDFFPNIRIAPRAHTWTWGGGNYASLGGAASIDIAFRRRGVSWWEQEVITQNETRKLIDMCVGKDISVLFTHDGPLEVTQQLYGHGNVLDEDTARWAEKSGIQVQHACQAIEPAALVCGHHHLRLTEVLSNGTLVEILDRDTSPYDRNVIEVSSLT